MGYDNATVGQGNGSSLAALFGTEPAQHSACEIADPNPVGAVRLGAVDQDRFAVRGQGADSVVRPRGADRFSGLPISFVPHEAAADGRIGSGAVGEDAGV